MRKVVLYGEMAKRFGKFHSFEVKTCAEAIRALRANFKDFESYMISREFKILVGKSNLTEAEEIKLPSSDRETIRIAPVLSGSKSGFFKALLGVALIGISIVAAPLLGPLANSVGLVGASMVLGGVSQMLTKAPAAPSSSQTTDHGESYIFNGPVNSSAQGDCITLVYGRMLVGSKVISAGIVTYDR